MPKPIVAWSYSAITAYENCPYKYYMTKVTKAFSDVNDDNKEGADNHESFEHYVARKRRLPDHLEKYQPVLEKLRTAAGEVLVEQQFALDEQYTQCGYKDWNRAWVRAVSDYLNINGQVARMVDYKFGKVHKDPDQNMLVAGVLFQTYPQLEQVKTVYWYVKHDKFVPFDFTRADIPRIWNRYLPTVNKMVQAKVKDDWPKYENPLCAYCPVASCHYNCNPKLAKPT